MSKKDWETDGYRNGDPIYCPVNAYGDCPYCDQCNLCHIADPVEECDDFASFFESWDEWVNADDVDPDAPTDFSEDEIKWATKHLGYNPCEGCTDDCFACGYAEFVYD